RRQLEDGPARSDDRRRARRAGTRPGRERPRPRGRGRRRCDRRADRRLGGAAAGRPCRVLPVRCRRAVRRRDARARDRPSRSVARARVARLAGEIVLMARRALRDLGLLEADVVLGGGMLARGEGLLYDEVVARLPAGARAVAAVDPPVLGAALAALDAAAATD